MKRRTIKAMVLALHEAHPDWRTSRMMREVGCTRSAMTQIRYRCGIPIPPDRPGRRRKRRKHRGLLAARPPGMSSGLLSVGV